MSEELAKQELTAKEVKAQVNLIQEVMNAVMKKDVHYGVIPGCKQPSLYKAGAEKILSTFRISVEPIVEDLSNHDEIKYRVTARGVHQGTGIFVGAGIGECSSNEDKYKWRGAISDAEWNATSEDRKRIKYCKPTDWNKQGEIRQIRTNPADLANTVLKMAKKRAQVDLTLTATAASDCFTQDLEDIPDEYDNIKGPAAASGKPSTEAPKKKEAATAEVVQGEVVTVQIKEIKENSGEKNGKPWKSWTITSSEDGKYGTFSETFAKEAARAEIYNLPVEITHKPANKYGMEIITLFVEPTPEEG